MNTLIQINAETLPYKEGIFLFIAITILLYLASLLAFASSIIRRIVFSLLASILCSFLCGMSYVYGLQHASQPTKEPSHKRFIAALPKPVIVPNIPAQPSNTITPEIISGENKEERLDKLKQRYEEIIINAKIFMRCSQPKGDEMSVIMESFLKESSQIDGTSNIYPQVVSAANGSYEAFYAEMKCTDPSLIAMLHDYEQFIQRLRERIQLQKP